MILDKDFKVDFTEYFTDSEEEDKGDLKKPWAYNQYTQAVSDTPKDPEMYYPDIEEEVNTQPLNITTDIIINDESTLNGMTGSAYEGDISTQTTDTTVDRMVPKKTRKRKLAPILRTAYYGRKRLLGGIRHFVSSMTEYSAGATLRTLQGRFHSTPYSSLL